MRIITKILLFYAVFCIIMFFMQRKLQYLPTGKLDSIENYQLTNFKTYQLITKDNIRVTAWFKKPKPKQKILLFFHGNAGNLGNRANKFKVFSENSDYGILAISYRGYAASEGKPSEAGLLIDAEAATDFLFKQGYNNKDIILYGESLGTGIAIRHALKVKPFALILEAPYSSIANIAKRSYWYLPVDLLLKDRFDSYKYVSKITAPIIIFHGNKDRIVPYAEGKLLYSYINSRKKFITIENAGHIEFDNYMLIKEIADFL